MGKTLVDRLGEEDARVSMRGVKRGQVLFIYKGRSGHCELTLEVCTTK